MFLWEKWKKTHAQNIWVTTLLNEQVCVCVRMCTIWYTLFCETHGMHENILILKMSNVNFKTGSLIHVYVRVCVCVYTYMCACVCVCECAYACLCGCLILYQFWNSSEYTYIKNEYCPFLNLVLCFLCMCVQMCVCVCV